MKSVYEFWIPCSCWGKDGPCEMKRSKFWFSWQYLPWFTSQSRGQLFCGFSWFSSH